MGPLCILHFEPMCVFFWKDHMHHLCASLEILQIGHHGITFDWDTHICHSVETMHVEGFQEGIEAHMQEVPCFVSTSMKGNFCLVNLLDMKDHWLLSRRIAAWGFFLVPAGLKKVLALWIGGKRKEGTCLLNWRRLVGSHQFLNQRTSTGGFSSLNRRMLQEAFCLVLDGLVGAPCFEACKKEVIS